AAIQMVRYHDHVERLFERVHRVRARRTCRGWNHIRAATHFNNVRCMASAGAFGMKRVDRSTLEGGNRIFDKAAFIERICMDQDLNVHVIRNGKAAIDRRGRRTPVFVQLQAASPRFNLLDESSGSTRVSFAEKAEVYGEGIRRL